VNSELWYAQGAASAALYNIKGLRILSLARSYYKLLGFDMAALRPSDAGPTQSDIKAAFRKEAMRTHPDKVVTGDDKTRDAATKRYRQLQDAYDVLRDPQRREMYDRGGVVG
jgi:DnaJ-class molecular chaperone